MSGEVLRPMTELEMLRNWAEQVRDCPRPTCWTCRFTADSLTLGQEPTIVLCRVGGRPYRVTRKSATEIIKAACAVLGAWNPDEPMDSQVVDEAVSVLAVALEEAEIRP